MIYFDKLFALKAKYKEALDEDARKRQQIEKNFADGWITESYRKKALEDQDAALEYCRKATLEAAEAVKAEAYSMLDRWDMPNAAKLPPNAAFLADNSPVTLTQKDMQEFVNGNRYNSTALRAAKEAADRRGLVLAFPPTTAERKTAFSLFADTITGAIQAGLDSGFYSVKDADQLLHAKIEANPNLADLEAVAASVAADGTTSGEGAAV